MRIMRNFFNKKTDTCDKVAAVIEKNKAAKENLKHKVSDGVSIAIMGFKDGLANKDKKNAG